MLFFSFLLKFYFNIFLIMPFQEQLVVFLVYFLFILFIYLLSCSKSIKLYECRIRFLFSLFFTHSNDNTILRDFYLYFTSKIEIFNVKRRKVKHVNLFVLELFWNSVAKKKWIVCLIENNKSLISEKNRFYFSCNLISFSLFFFF